MKRHLLFTAPLALAALALALVFGGPVFAMTHPKLVGITGKNGAFKITLTQSGKLVKTLKAGTYTFDITDGSSIHSFALDGPNKFAKDFTTIPFVGHKTLTLTLKKGSYKYYCAQHESTMFGHFKVT